MRNRLHPSITPALINFVNVDAAAQEIVVGGEIEGAGGTVVGELGGVIGFVGVVGGEDDLAISFGGVEEEDGVVDGELGEADEMNDGRAVVSDFLHEFCGHVLLLMTAEGIHDAPMTALDVALPGAPAFLLEKVLLGAAEIAEVGVAGNDDFAGIGEFAFRTAGEDAMDELTIGVGVGDGSGGIEAGVLKELARGTDDDEAVVGVIGFRVMRFADPFTMVVVVIIPDELVGVGEGVALEIEGLAGGDRRRSDGGRGAAGKECGDRE